MWRSGAIALVVIVMVPAPPFATGSGSVWAAADVPHPRLFLTSASLDAMAARARVGRDEWVRLRRACDARRAARGQRGTRDGRELYDGVLELGLCRQIERRLGETRLADAHGRRGAELLREAASDTLDPLRDDGYDIRFHGPALAIGYDWLHDDLSRAERAAVVAALRRWISAFATAGFGRAHPQGNYFAGYQATVALAGLAVRGEAPDGARWWTDWSERLFGGMIRPYYAAHLAGGGWPEGWGYGAFATLNLILPVWGAETALGIDLVHGAQPFRFPIEQGAHLMHFCWPDRRTMDDRGAMHTRTYPSLAPAYLFQALATRLAAWGEPLAPALQRYAAEVRAATGLDGEARPTPWQDMLLWDPAAPDADYQALPRSYLAPGMSTVAARSSWERDAVWWSFTAGPYVNDPGSGEQFYDQGSIAVVRGGQPFVVNAYGALLRVPGGEQADPDIEHLAYDDLYERHGGSGLRTLFNTWHVRAGRTRQGAIGPGQAHTRIDRFEDAGDYVLVRGAALEDMYDPPAAGAPRAVTRWTRQVVYLRPHLLVVDDATEVADPSWDRWLAFHVGGTPRLAGGQVEVRSGETRVGTVTPVWPAAATVRTVDLFDRHRVFRIELRSPGKERAQRWLTVLDAAIDASAVARATALDGGAGVVLRAGKHSWVVARGMISYRAPAAPTAHLVTDLEPGGAYRVIATGGRVRVEAGGTRRATSAGALRFETSEAGELR